MSSSSTGGSEYSGLLECEFLLEDDLLLDGCTTLFKEDFEAVLNIYIYLFRHFSTTKNVYRKKLFLYVIYTGTF